MEAVLKKMRLEVLQNTKENYRELQNIREGMWTFRDILRRYNKKDIEPTRESIVKMILFLPLKTIRHVKVGLFPIEPTYLSIPQQTFILY